MTSILIILNLFILETLLSIDNATVLALMVRHLPASQQSKALRYGVIGAFFFRGLCLLLASVLVKILWLKIIGGLFLLYLCYGHFFGKIEVEDTPKAKRFKWLNPLWSTIVFVEIMDLSFSLDNIFAAVAITNNIYLIMVGVCMGIVSMRFVARGFGKLIDKYPTLSDSAFIVILLLGIKLIVSGALDYTTGHESARVLLNSHGFDMAFSGLMLLVFAIPVISNRHQSA